jgi:hypothetical protein
MKLTYTSLLCGIVAISCSTLTAWPAHALTTWDLSTVAFADGTTATGSFSFDSTSDEYSNVDVVVTGILYSTTFTSNDIRTTFSTSSKLLLCTGGNSGCTTGSDFIYLFTGNNFGNAALSPQSLISGSVTSPATADEYGLFGSTKSAGVSGTVTLSVGATGVPFSVPGGENVFLFSSILTLAGISSLKKYFSTIQNSCSDK